MSVEITTAEVKKHNSKKSVWIVIHNDVYDVTKFLEEHPGGADSLLGEAGKDGTQAFEDVGHSQDARILMEKFKIGRLPATERNKSIEECHDRKSLKPKASIDSKFKDPSSGVERRAKKIIVPIEKSSSKIKKGKKNKQSRKKGGSPSRQSEKSKSGCSSQDGRVQCVVVPRESSNWWKWALLALAGAIVVGVTYKKFAT